MQYTFFSLLEEKLEVIKLLMTGTVLYIYILNFCYVFSQTSFIVKQLFFQY